MTPKPNQPKTTPTTTPAAIVGIGCLFAKSNDLKSYWRLLRQGHDAITDVPDTHWTESDYFHTDPNKPDHTYCKRGGFLSPYPFDPAEFGIPPAILEATDTSQLLGLVAAKMALEDAGYAERPFDRERTSVILGVTGTQELVIPLGARLGHPIWRRALKNSGIDDKTAEDVIERIGDGYVKWQENSFPGLLGNVVAGRISNRLNLGGTNCVVDAACASSMSALHLALMELTTGRSDMVLSGGVDAINDIFMHMCFAKTRVLSATGDARPFSKDADGTVLGEGIGILAIKRLADAERDGDRIYAVIKAIGSSSDGKSQSIYAPRAEGQAKALRNAYRMAAVDPSTVDLVEAHGTGTRVGDAVEFSALNQVFSESADPARRNGNRCALGTVKSMIGHTKAAAGAAGMIKATLALYHKTLPPTLKAETPDPKLNIEQSPFYLNTESRPWPANTGHPRRSGVSAFGFGGSNFHVVLEEYDPRKKEIAWDGSVQLIALSGDNAQAIRAQLEDFENRLTEHPTQKHLAELAADARQTFSPAAASRLVMVVDGLEGDPIAVNRTLAVLNQARQRLDGNATHRPPGQTNIYFHNQPHSGKTALVFPGQGSQYVGMGKDLTCCFPQALNAIDAANAQANDRGRLSNYIYPPKAHTPGKQQSQLQNLTATDIAQPAIGAVSLAMFKTLTDFGVKPDAVCGHSYGELTALCAAGRLDEDTFLKLSVARGQAMAAAGKSSGAPANGGMLAVSAPLAQIDRLIEDHDLKVILANRNSPRQGVLSGSETDIAVAEEKCHAAGLKCKRLPVAAAFHSPLVEAARRPFAECVAQVDLQSSPTPVYANTTAQPYPEDTTAAKQLLARQLVSPVNFVEQIQNLYADGVRTFIEVGPKTVLSGLIQTILTDDETVQTLAVDASAGRKSGIADLAHCLARLAAGGYPVALTKWEPVPPKSRRALMNIPIAGANYRPETPERPAAQRKSKSKHQPEEAKTVATTTGKQATAQTPPATRLPQLATRVDHAPTPQPQTSPREQDMEKTAAHPTPPADSSQPLLDALSIVQEGLKSMQVLQAQTAQAHQRFLETQQEAGRTLQQMMDSTQRLTEASLGLAPAAPENIVRPVKPPVAPPSPAVAPPVAAEVAPQPVVASPTPQEKATPPAATQNLSKTLLAIVSELTGYPEETLDLEMDIEADLGIDSIKRVEILSSLEEKMPGLPGVEPEMMGTLKTLGQILNHFDSPAADALAATAADTAPSSDTENAVVREAAVLQDTLLAVVGELTGYPAETLGMDMDIEADLGIDSIKRVEILSSLEEKMPGLPGVEPEMLGTLKTLGQIVTYFTQANAAAPAGEEKAPAPPPESTSAGPHLKATLLEVVSELTGYPTQTLDLEMDIEADLGIDSIKRVEILSALEERQPGLPQVAPDMMGGLKTLGQILAYLDQTGAEPAGQTPTEPVTDAQPAATATPQTLERRLVRVETAPALQSDMRITLPATHTVYLTADTGGLAVAMADRLKKENIAAEVLPLDELVTVLQDEKTRTSVAGLIIVGDNADTDAAFLKNAFLAAKHACAALTAAAELSGALFATISRLDGAFGFGDAPIANPMPGGLAGLTKTAAIEWPNVTCRALDIDPDWTDTNTMAQAAVAQVLHSASSAPIEIGLTAGSRHLLTLAPVPYTQTDPKPDLTAEDVVVISGGARGVTAHTARALADATRCKLVLLGRSEAPFDEPAWLQPLQDEAAIKKAIIDHDLAGQKATPVVIEKHYRRYRANREISATLDRLAKAGARPCYFAVDIRDKAAVSQVCKDIRSTCGPIRAVVHGAGVLQDRRIADKTAAQFELVFATKVKGLQNLLAATQNDALKYVVLFSSVAGRFGNQGQVDYAMANEVLNKTARQIAAAQPDRRIVAINWGPWDGGMVTPALRAEFKRRGIDLIPVDTGARALVAEMATVDDPPAEVILGSGLMPNAHARPQQTVDQQAPPPADDLKVLIKREVSPQTYPILDAHVLNGTPVVPFALIAEWLGHGALHQNPGLVLAGLEDIRLLKGIRLDEQKKVIRFLSGKARKNGAHFEVDVQIRNGVQDNREVIHSRARAILSNTPPAPPAIAPAAGLQTTGQSMDIDKIYATILFHGDELRGIKQILTCTADTIAARLRTAPPPKSWIRDPLRSRWIADPLVLDAAFQLGIIWSHEQKGLLSLPSYAASYRQYCRRFPQGDITAVMQVKSATAHKMTSDIYFLDSAEKVIAICKGYEAVMDPTLAKAFRQRTVSAA